MCRCRFRIATLTSSGFGKFTSKAQVGAYPVFNTEAEEQFRSRVLVDIMRVWFEYDPVALALLALGLFAIQLLAFIL